MISRATDTWPHVLGIMGVTATIMAVIILATLASNCEAAEGKLYFEGGVSSISGGCPELCSSEPVVNLGLGFAMPLGTKGWYMELYGRRANITTDFRGIDGHTQMGVNFRRYLDLSGN